MCLCLFASGAVSSVYSERVKEVSTSVVIVIPLCQDGCTPQQLLIYTPEDMVFDQMLNNTQKLSYRLGVSLRNSWSIVSEPFLNIRSFKVCLKFA